MEDGDSTKEDWWDHLPKLLSTIAALVVAAAALVQSSTTALYVASALLPLLLLLFAWPKIRSWGSEVRQKRRRERFISKNGEEFRDLVDSFGRYCSSDTSEITTPINETLNELDKEVELPDPVRLRGIYQGVSGLVGHLSFTYENFPFLLWTFLALVRYHNRVFVHEPLKIIRKEDPPVDDYRNQKYDKYRHEYLRLMTRCQELKDAAEDVFTNVHFHYKHPPQSLTK